ncbi:MAG: hypothetical protein O2973_04060 [Gemmatimonadetes bacterium]|nr:hypothetical protein [Gemmatimonadota bacterium]
MAIAMLAIGALLAVFALPVSAQSRGAADTTLARTAGTDRAGQLPAGYGSLRRDDVVIEIHVQGLTVRAIPLTEDVIRALAPDSYRALNALAMLRAPQLERIRTRLGLPAIQAWHVAFFNVQQGEARYDPRGMLIRSAGRDYRPLDIIPLVPGFEDGRLGQGKTVDAIFAFDPGVALDQPLVVTLAGEQNATWADVLQRLERERASIWSRAAGARKPPID